MNLFCKIWFLRRLNTSSWPIKRTISNIYQNDSAIYNQGRYIVLAQVKIEFTWEIHLVFNLHLSFPRRPFRRRQSRTLCCTLSCELSRLLENLELRYAFNTLAAVTPDRTPYPKLRNAFGVNRRETFWRTLGRSKAARSFIFQEGKTQFSTIVPSSEKKNRG